MKLKKVLILLLTNKWRKGELLKSLMEILMETSDQGAYKRPNHWIVQRIFLYVSFVIRQLISYLPWCGRVFSYESMSTWAEKHMFRNPDLRKMFEHKCDKIELLPQSANHTHAKAASLRTSVNIKLVELARGAGFRPYVVSYSNSDHNMGLAGSRSFYWAKDLSIPSRIDEIKDQDCLIFIDVDYYADMNEYLKMFKPMLIYTLYPKALTCQDENLGHAYCIADNCVYYTVRGGATYAHRLWNYKSDVVSIVDDYGSLLTYDVTQKEIDGYPDRRIIFLMPRTSTPWPCYHHVAYEDGLNYREFKFGPVNVSYEHITDEVSLGMNYTVHSVEMPAKMFVAIHHKLQKKKTTTPTLPDIETMLIHEASLQTENVKKSKDSRSKIELRIKEAETNKEYRLLKELRRQLKDHKEVKFPVYLVNPKITAALLDQIFPWVMYLPDNVVTTSTIPTTFAALGPQVYDENKPVADLITTPLVSNPATAPAKNMNNDLSAIQGRVTKYINYTTPSVQIKTLVDDFVKAVVPVEGIVRCYDVEEVLEIQNKAAQKARANMVFDSLGVSPENGLSSFLKGEAYADPNDPRIITQMKAAFTIMMSAITIPFKKEILKQHQWYGPGKTPDELMNIISGMATNGFVDTDYTRFDGTISQWLQMEVVKVCYLRGLQPMFRQEFSLMFDKIFKHHCKSQSGVKYEAGPGTRSGSPTTTDGNTIINAFCVYVSLRDLGYRHDEAWKRLGIYAGDDGLTPLIDGLQDSIKRNTSEMGLEVKIEEHGPNQPVPFLGRIIPRPMTNRDSYQDPKRTLPKLHLTFNKQVSIKQAAYNKAQGYIVTDSMTPIISTWATKVIQLSGCVEVENMRHDEQYRISNAWPQIDRDLIRTDYARYMGIQLSDIEVQEVAISDVLGDFPLKMPVIWENEPKYKLDHNNGYEVVSHSGNRVINTNTNIPTCLKTHKNYKPHTPSGKKVEAITSTVRSKNTTQNIVSGKGAGPENQEAPLLKPCLKSSESTASNKQSSENSKESQAIRKDSRKEQEQCSEKPLDTPIRSRTKTRNLVKRNRREKPSPPRTKKRVSPAMKTSSSAVNK